MGAAIAAHDWNDVCGVSDGLPRDPDDGLHGGDHNANARVGQLRCFPASHRTIAEAGAAPNGRRGREAQLDNDERLFLLLRTEAPSDMLVMSRAGR